MNRAALRMPETRRARGWFVLQLAIGWLPVVALYATTLHSVHGISVLRALVVSTRAILAAALLGLIVLRFTERLPWPRPVSVGFALRHSIAAVAYALTWRLLASAVESVFRGEFVLFAPAGIAQFLLLGVWLYVAVAGVSYAVGATERAARAEAAAVRAQLAALRGQLDPHFLFNALHTVVQLIPEDPDRAAQSADQLAGLLRTVLEEDRDLIALAEERAFVERYLALERLRFGDRLEIAFVIDADTTEALVPAFVLQTLVENAVRHGASSKVETTRITISAQRAGEGLVLTVADTGVGADLSAPTSSAGTGLRRLRERLDALFGQRAGLRVESRSGSGFTATVALPLPLAPDDER